MNRRDCFHNPFQRPWMVESGAALSREDFVPSKKTAEGILAGAVTGSIETTITYPAEYVKTRLQLEARQSKPKYTGIIDVVKKTVQSRGFKGLYRGYNVCLYGSVPKVAIRFGVFESLKTKNSDEKGRLTKGKRMLCGLGAGMCEAILIVTPAETILVKFIHDHQSPDSKFTGKFLQGIRGIVKNYGIRGLYKGLLPTVLSEGINHTIRFYGVETLKDWYTCGNPDQRINKLYVALFGLVSGAVAVTANTPFDVMKVSLQGLHSRKYTSTLNCAFSIAMTEGFFGFYKGFVPRLLLVCLDCTITFAVYDLSMEIVEKLFENY